MLMALLHLDTGLGNNAQMVILPLNKKAGHTPWKLWQKGFRKKVQR